MKTLLLLVSLNFCLIKVVGQLKLIPTSRVYQQSIHQTKCLDSNGMVSKFCPLEIYNFKINVYKAYLDRQKKELRLIGRVCLFDTLSCTGVSGVEIFKAVKKDNKLLGRIAIGETTEGKKSLSNNGFFDVTINFGKNESLFFYNPSFTLEEFTISKLLQK